MSQTSVGNEVATHCEGVRELPAFVHIQSNREEFVNLATQKVVVL